MIVVTGAGRCGSSLMMQTLHLLGVPLFGDPLGGEYNTLASFDSTKVIGDQIRKKNPKGYYETDIKTVLDMCPSSFPDHEGMALKALGGTFPNIGNDVIEKVIVCLRKDRRKQAKSMHELLKLEGQIHDNETQDLGYTGQCVGKIKGWTEKYILRNQYFSLDRITKKVLEGNLPALIITFEEILSDPEDNIQKVISFLGISSDNIEDAIANVDKR